VVADHGPPGGSRSGRRRADASEPAGRPPKRFGDRGVVGAGAAALRAGASAFFGQIWWQHDRIRPENAGAGPSPGEATVLWADLVAAQPSPPREGCRGSFVAGSPTGYAAQPGPRSSADRAAASGAVCAGSIPAEGAAGPAVAE